MSLRRFELRPIASRRLRAALLLVFALGLIGISQTRLGGAELGVALLALGAIFADGWRRTRMPRSGLLFSYRPLGCALQDTDAETPMRCTHASVYPWLIVLQFDRDPKTAGRLPAWLNRAVVLLPDSLGGNARDEWRRLLVWARLTRRQLAQR